MSQSNNDDEKLEIIPVSGEQAAPVYDKLVDFLRAEKVSEPIAYVAMQMLCEDIAKHLDIRSVERIKGPSGVVN